MCKRKKVPTGISDEEMMENLDSSDVSMTESSDESEADCEVSNLENDEDNKDSDLEETIEEDPVDEEEDETIKAIKRECNRERDHPPILQCEDFITDISFHPVNNIIAVASIVGDVLLYQYSNEENVLLRSVELHTKACRDIEFSVDGNLLYSTSKDKSIMISDVETGKLVQFYEKSHDVPVYCITVIDEHLFSTGTNKIISY